jgi:methionyl-tRNA formyltransferase
VVTQPDRPSGRGQRLQEPPVKRVALAHGLPVLQPERLKTEAFLSALASFAADLGVVAAYGKILNDAVLQTPRLGLVNVHASLLPRFRGAAPVHRAVMAGETVTGVTIMRIVRALDAGPMLATASRPISQDETSDEVERDLAALGGNLLLRVVDDLALGRATEVPQDESQATYAPRLEKSEGLIDWQEPAKRIHDRIRGLHPWPHAYTYLDGTRYILVRSRLEVMTLRPAGVRIPEPGETLDASGDVLNIATGDGVVRILEIQPEGRRPLTSREFLAGRRLKVGTVFGR